MSRKEEIQIREEEENDFNIDIGGLDSNSPRSVESPKSGLEKQLSLSEFNISPEREASIPPSPPRDIDATLKAFPDVVKPNKVTISPDTFSVKFVSPKSPRPTVSPEDDLFNDASGHVSPDLEGSLDLFTDVSTSQKKSPRARPPRPPKPPSVTVQTPDTAHPLMLPEINPEDEFMCSIVKSSCETKQLGVRFSKGGFMKKRPKSPTPSVKSDVSDRSDTGSLEVKIAESVDGSEKSETNSGSSSSKKLKYQAFKAKLYHKYYDWYAGRGKPKDGEELQEETGDRERHASESSDGSFLEITADDIAVIPEPDELPPPESSEPLESAAEETVPFHPPPPDPRRNSSLIPIPSSGSFHKYITPQQQKHVFYSLLVCACSILFYIMLYYSNVFLQVGILLLRKVILLLCKVIIIRWR